MCRAALAPRPESAVFAMAVAAPHAKLVEGLAGSENTISITIAISKVRVQRAQAEVQKYAVLALDAETANSAKERESSQKGRPRGQFRYQALLTANLQQKCQPGCIHRVQSALTVADAIARVPIGTILRPGCIHRVQSGQTVRTAVVQAPAQIGTILRPGFTQRNLRSNLLSRIVNVQSDKDGTNKKMHPSCRSGVSSNQGLLAATG
jgi:hypothetical protein